ncbi:MAG: methionyl-tRNA formyltransferase [Microgenomates group bacterium Gr01-1014_5]|nr:MAG: methionyl-tRNA formyltransferase [Microgenomates group bacterium Gr01-1014_5]
MSKVIFFGTPNYVIPVLEALKKTGHDIVAVVTQPPKPVGRRKILTPSPVEIWAKKNGVKVLNKHRDLNELSPEVGVLASYGKIVTKEVLDIFPKGIINIHPSLLPKWRGACPVQEQILAGEKNLGISLMVVDEQMDHGPILEQQVVEIGSSDTQQSLLVKGFKIGAQMLVKILPLYVERRIIPNEQDHSKATYTYKTMESKNKAYFDIDNPPNAAQLDQMIRAFYPWPIAWTIWKRDTTHGKRDTIIKFFPGKKIQIEGKNPVNYEEFLQAYPDFPLKVG